MPSNPLFEPSKLPFQAPLFDEIKPEDYAPAFEKGMEEQLKELDAIKKQAEAPTFANTLEALELSGRLLARARQIFHNLCSANSSPELQKLEQEYAARFAKHQDSMYLDSELYARIKAVYDTRESLADEERRLVEYYEQEFTIAGAYLDEAKKSELKQVNERLASLETEFGKKLLGTNKTGSLIVDTVEELAGLSADEIDAAKKEAESAGQPLKYAIRLLNTTQQPCFASLTNRDTRRRLFEASLKRAEKGDENDTQSTLEEIVRLRLKKANILGKKCFADWRLQGRMATTETAQMLLKDMATAALAKAKIEEAEMQALIDSQGGNFKLAPWDWSFYGEQVRKEKYSLEESELKPYFELMNVVEKGVFYAANQLYGITMTRRTDLPVYDEDVMVYEVQEADGTTVALYYLDPYARSNKKGGAWMSNYVKQSHLLKQKPVVVNVCNFPKPAAGKPCLLSSWNVITIFHEFGHGLHGMLSNLRFPAISGANVARDFLEFPSQVNEHWATHEPVLMNYARHYETGEVMPAALVQKMRAAATFKGGFDTLEVVKAALIDMYWHIVESESALLPAPEMDQAAVAHYGVEFPNVPARYHSSYFSHIFQGSYPAGYYVYQWARVLDCDGFEWFLEHGGMSRTNGAHLRETVLSVGNSVEANTAYHNFAGRTANLDPFLRDRGLVTPSQ